MAYRFDDTPFNPEEHLPKLYVRNGAQLKAAFGCYYLNPHNSRLHDFIGWPRPNHPDSICQIPSDLVEYGFNHKTMTLDEIHLLNEGYTGAVLAFEDDDLASNLLNASAEIDSETDNIVRISMTPQFDTFTDNNIDIVFTVFVFKNDTAVYDAVFHGVVSVMPGAYPHEVL